MGPDGHWATADDGLCINSNVPGNPFIGHTASSGGTQLAPQRDILQNLRLPVADIGAYQHLPLTETRAESNVGPIDISFKELDDSSQNLKSSPTEYAPTEFTDPNKDSKLHSQVESHHTGFQTTSAHTDADATDHHSDDLQPENTQSSINSNEEQIYAQWGMLDHTDFLSDLQILIERLASESLGK